MLIKSYDPPLQILGRPSHELAENMSSQEKERVGQQRTALGEEGLKTKAQKLEEAIQHHEVGCTHTHTHHDLNDHQSSHSLQTPIPNDLASSLPVPGTDNIHFHPLIAMGNHKPANQLEELPEYSRFPVHNVPFFFQVNHIHSAFVEVSLFLFSPHPHPSISLFIAHSILPSLLPFLSTAYSCLGHSLTFQGPEALHTTLSGATTGVPHTSEWRYLCSGFSELAHSKNVGQSVD